MREEVSELVDFIAPYGRKYIIKKNRNWVTVDKPLTQEIIFDHVNGEITAGAFGRYKVDHVCLDLDFHETFITPEIQETVRWSRYKLVSDTLGAPSLVSQSSKNKGLHLWYKFNTPIYYGLVKHLILKLLKTSEQDLKTQFNIDILPTPRQAVAFPHAVKRGGYILEPQTLKILKHPNDLTGSNWLNDIIKKAKIYSFTELFQDTPESVIVKHYKSRQAITLIKAIDRIESTGFGTPKQGETNSFIGNVVWEFYRAGIKQADIIQDKIAELFRSHEIRTKPDTEGRGLYARIKSHLKRMEKNKKSGLYIENYKKHLPGLFDQNHAIAIAEWLSSQFGLSKPIRNSMVKFIYELIQWENYIRGLTLEQTILLDVQYKYFYHRVKNQKLTPLPYKLLQRWNQRYFILIEYLKQAGIITREVKYYNPATAKLYSENLQGTCNYYRVTIPEYQ